MQNDKYRNLEKYNNAILQSRRVKKQKVVAHSCKIL